MSMISKLVEDLRYLERYERETGDTSHYAQWFNSAADTIEALSEKCRTIDAEPVRHGNWLISEYEYFDCSECGESYYSGCDSHEEAEERLRKHDVYAYFPYCGAKMDGESEVQE